MRQIYRILSAGVLCLTCVPGLAQAQVRLEKAWELNEGLSRPESVIYDAGRDVLYVSSIGGNASEKDGNGYLSKVSVDGAVLEKEWVPELHAPKGLAMAGGKLYVADIDELVEIDPENGRVTAHYEAEGAEFLNDVTADEAGHVYVSDSGTGVVYRLSDGKLDVWLQDDRIVAPNGLWAGPEGLVIAAATSGVESPGGARFLQSITYMGKEIAALTDETPLGGIDAVEPDGDGGYFLSDWGAGKVLYWTPEAGAMDLVQLGQGTADLDYVADKDMIYLPVMMSDQLIGYRVERVK